MTDPPVEYVIRVEEVLWGIALMTITMTMHGCGMVLTLSATARVSRALRPSRHRVPFIAGVSVLVLATWLIVLVQLAEVGVWAAFLCWKNAMPSGGTAFYFALVNYSTVGSKLDLPIEWRLLGGLIAIAGLLSFAWSTGVLMLLARRFQNEQLAALDRRWKERREKPAG